MNQSEKNNYSLGLDTILNSNFSFKGHSIDKFFETIVKATGYPYFSWNNKIFKVNDYQEGYSETGISTDAVAELWKTWNTYINKGNINRSGCEKCIYYFKCNRNSKNCNILNPAEKYDKIIRTIHKLKTIQPFFDLAWTRIKGFEVRLNDRDYKVGDILLLEEFDISTNTYLKRKILVEVTFILDDIRFVKENFIIMQFNEINRFDEI